MHKKVHSPPAFTVLTRIYPYGTDPSVSPPVAPATIRNTVTYGPMHTDKNAHLVVGRSTANPAAPPSTTPATASLTVNNNDFSTGRTIIYLGNYKLISNIDFVPGANVNATAVAIANAVDGLPGFSGTNPVPGDVQIEYYAGVADQITFEIRYYGSVTNFLAVTPNDGWMAVGYPSIGPPLLT